MTKRDDRTWKDAEATIEGNTIVIRLTVKHIPFAMSYHPDDTFRGIKVTDLDGFAREVVRALNDEDERGTTPIHHLFDEACDAAIEDGSQCVSLPEDR